MAPPVIVCPHCAKKFRGKEDMTGKKIKCPFCQTAFVVGAAASASAAPVPQVKATQPKPKPAPKPAPAPIAASPMTPKPEMDERFNVGEQTLEFRCPNCAELMPSDEATICLHCGYNTLTREWGKSEITVAITPGQHFMHLLPGILAFLAISWCVLDRILYCLWLETWAASTNWRYLQQWMFTEPIKLWTTMMALALVFFLGRYCFKRLVLNPKPEETKLSK